MCDGLGFWEKDMILNKTRLYTVAGGEAVIFSASYLALGQLWYADQRAASFRFVDDGPNWLGMDKVGHSMASYAMGYAGLELLEWAGISSQKARWYCGSLGLVFLTGVEIFDGHSSGYGFSWSDMLANAAGTVLLIRPGAGPGRERRIRY
ncbi:MAG: DUF2279 domain-containing protein [Owenweeksia sp.]|nr:DUF2279 domain-containing protein [Owenweeksia sp.]